MKRTVLVATLVLASGCYVGFYSPPVSVGVRVPSSIRWELIPGTSIYYSNDPGVSVFYYNNRYYRVVNGTWYIAAYWGAGWSVAASVPDVFLWIPAAHPAYRVVVHHPRYRHYHQHPQPRVVPHTPSPSSGSGRPAKGKKGKDEKETPPATTGGTWIRR